MRGGRVRFLAQIHDAPGTPLNLNPAKEELQKIVDERIGGITITSATLVDLLRDSPRSGPRIPEGRVFLAGDAAHIHSPAGGRA